MGFPEMTFVAHFDWLDRIFVLCPIVSINSALHWLSTTDEHTASKSK